MATHVEVDISDRAIISALNTPGGAVFKWRDDTAKAIIDHAYRNSPVGNPLDMRHRPSWVGEYQQSWASDRKGSNGARVRATIFNGAGHADIVEFGRRSTKGGSFERFSWSKHKPPGSISLHEGTSGRAGKHVLRNAVNARGTSTGDYSPV